MTQMVTRCPTCSTAFRVTSTQLESAKGAVRCGSCLHIFKALDYLVKTPEEDKAVAATLIKTELPKTEQAKAEHAQAKEAIQTKVDEVKVEAPKVEASKVDQVNPEQPKPKAPAPIAVPVPVPETLKEAPTVTPPKVEQTPVKKPVVPVPADQSAVIAKVTATKPAPLQTSFIETSTPIAKPVINKAKILADDDDILISDDMDQASEKPSTYEFDGFIDLDMRPKQTVSLFEREIRYEPPHEDNGAETADESWAEGLLDDDGEPLHQFKKTVVAVPVVEVKQQLTDTDVLLKDYSESSSAKQTDTTYSGPVFSIINEDEAAVTASENKEEPFFSEAFLNATRAPEPVSQPSHFAKSLFDQEPESDIDEVEKSSKRPVKSSKMRAFDTSRAALLMNIMPAPVEFTARRMRRWYQRKLWPTLAIIMCVLFFFQIAYFKFDYFSRVEPYRTAYLFTCPLLGCEVPALVDTSQILATNLVVRNHPDTANALMVDAILINNAPFEQPFPDLILSFSKLDETPVASRRFTPKEYIGGELAGMKYIPQRQPVHITLEISDPGPEAVNYTLATH